MAKTAHREKPTKVVAQVSQASRQMSRAATGEVATFLEEYNQLVQEKRQIESQLGRYSKASMLKEQQRVRRETRNNINAWINRKAALESERKDLVDQKMDIEQRISLIKERAMQEKRERSDFSDPGATRKQEELEVSKEILVELRKIRILLEGQKTET